MKRKVLQRLFCATLSAAMIVGNISTPYAIDSVYAAAPDTAELTQVTDEMIDEMYHAVNYKALSVHDPSVIKDGETYYVFGSHTDTAKTTDLMNWTGVNAAALFAGVSNVKDDAQLLAAFDENAFHGQIAVKGTAAAAEDNAAAVEVIETVLEEVVEETEETVETEVQEEVEETEAPVEESEDAAETVEAETVVEVETVAEVQAVENEATEETVVETEEAAEETVVETEEAVEETVVETEEAAEETVVETEEAAEETVAETEEAAEETVVETEEAVVETVMEVVEETVAEEVVAVDTAAGETVMVDFGTFDAGAWSTASAGLAINGNLWAPDVVWNPTMNKYCMYLSLNGNHQNSVIILLTSDAIEGPYVYQGPVVYTGFTAVEGAPNHWSKTDIEYALGEMETLPERYQNISAVTTNDAGKIASVTSTWGDQWPHAIDAAVFYDGADLWMVYGSWSGGIYMLELDENTGLRDYTVTYESNYDTENPKSVKSDPYFGTKVAGGYYVSGEGPYIEKIGDYYYLFMSYGFYAPNGGYNMRIFRSENPNGPFVDTNGTSAIFDSFKRNFTADYGVVEDTRGMRLMTYYQWDHMEKGEVAQGHNSAFVDDDGRAYVIYHTKLNDGTAVHELRVHELFQNENGWIVASPFQYAEDDKLDYSKAPEGIAGDYEIIIAEHSLGWNEDCGELGGNYKNGPLAPIVTVTLENDGKITKSGEECGSWTVKENSPYATIVIDGQTFSGVFAKVTKDSAGVRTMTFTAVDEASGETLWGAQKLDDMAVLVDSVKNPSFAVPTQAYGSFTLPSEGNVEEVKIYWESKNPTVINDEGTVLTELEEDMDVTFTMTMVLGEYYYTKDYVVKLLASSKAQDDTILVGEALTGETLELAQYSDGSKKIANPFYVSNTAGLDISGGVSIEFDAAHTGAADIWAALFAFNGPAGKLYFTQGSYLGYNTGNWYDANYRSSSEIVKDYIGEAIEASGKETAHVKINLNPDGFDVYVDDVLAYDETIRETENGDGTLTDYTEVLTWLQDGAPDLYFGSGSWWTNAANATISNMKFYASKMTDEKAVDAALAALANEMPSVTSENITLPTTGVMDTTITWESSHADIIAVDGTVNVPRKETDVTLTATVKKGDVSKTIEFVITVKRAVTSNGLIKKDLVELTAVDQIEMIDNPFYGLNLESLNISYKITIPEGAYKSGYDGLFSFYNSATGGRVSLSSNPYICYNPLGGDYLDINAPNDGANNLLADWAFGEEHEVSVILNASACEIWIDGVCVYENAPVNGAATYADVLAAVSEYDKFSWGTGANQTAYWGTQVCTLKDVSISTNPYVSGAQEEELVLDTEIKAMDNPFYGQKLKEVVLDFTVNFADDAYKNGWDGLLAFYDHETKAGGRVSLQSAPYICYNDNTGLYMDINRPAGTTDSHAATVLEKGVDYHYYISITPTQVVMKVDDTTLEFSESSGGGANYQTMLDFISGCRKFSWGADSTNSYWGMEKCTIKNADIIGYYQAVDPNEAAVEADLAALVKAMPLATFEDITLPVTGEKGSSIAWTSSNEAVLSAEGKVTEPEKDTEVELTATVSKGEVSKTETFTVLVKVANSYGVDFAEDEIVLDSTTYIKSVANPYFGKDLSEIEIDYKITIPEGAYKSGYDGLFSFYTTEGAGRVSFQSNPYICYNMYAPVGEENKWTDINSPAEGTNNLLADWAFGEEHAVKVKLNADTCTIWIDGEVVTDQPAVAGNASYAEVLEAIGNYEKLSWGTGANQTAYWGTQVCTLKDVTFKGCLDELWVKPIPTQTYTGKKIVPAVEVYNGTTKLVAKKDYTLTIKQNTNVGQAQVTVKGKGNYTGSDVLYFDIAPKSLKADDITVNESLNATIKSNGKLTNPKVTVKMGKKALKAGRDYEVVWPTDKMTEVVDGVTVYKPGNYTVVVKAAEVEGKICNFADSVEIPYDVLSAGTIQMSKAKVKAASTSYVDYEAHKADASKVEVTYGSGAKKRDLVKENLVTINYPETVSVGKNNVITVTAKEGSGFYGTKTVKFTVTGEKINAKNIAVTVSANNFTYTGEEIRYGENGIDPLVVTKTAVSGNEIVPVAELEEGKDYKLVYKNNVKAGKATVSVVGINGYTGKKDVKFTISKADISVTGNVIAVGPVADQVYTGKAITPALDVTVNDIPLTVKKDYTVKYAANKNVGTAKVTVTLKGNFKGKVETEFAVVAKPLSDADITATDVYAVLNKDGNFKNPKVTVKMGKTALKANRDYVVDWDHAVDVSGNTVSGNALSQPGTYTVPIHAAADTEKAKCNFTGSTQIALDVLANGTVMMKKVTVKAASTAYADYEAYKDDASKVTVTYGKGSNKVDLVAAGLVDVTYPNKEDIVIGKNNVITVTAKEGSGFYGSKSVKFTVTGEKITAKNIKITVSGNSFDYTGEEVRYGENGIDPIVVTKTTVSGNEIVPVAELEEGKDYKLVYKNNVNAGKATVSVVGMGGYTGKKDIKFTIKKEELNWLAALAEFLDNLF